MLTKPRHGWTDVIVCDQNLGTASYLTDVPMDTLISMIAYLQPDNALPFGIQYDAEGYFFGLQEFNDEIFFVHDNTERVPVFEDRFATWQDYYGFVSAKPFVRMLAGELIADIMDNLEAWVFWEYSIEEQTEDERQARRQMLTSKCEELKQLLHENKQEKGE